MQVLRAFKYLKKQEWIFFVICCVFIVFQTWLDLKLPDYMATITTLVETEGSEMSEILRNGGYMLLCAVGSMVAAILCGFFAAKIAAGLAKTLREKVYNQTLSFSMEEINDFSTASLINRTTNDITQVQMIVAMGLQLVVKAPIMCVWAIVKITGKSWQWTAATAVAVVVMAVVFVIIIMLAMPKFRMVQKLTDNVNRVTREQLTGLRVVRAYNAESYQQNKFEKANTDLTKTNLFAQRVMAIMQPSIISIQSILSLAIYWIGAYVIDAADITEKIGLFSDMVVFSSYAMMIVLSIMMMAIIFVMLPRASVSAGRILEVINKSVRIQDGTNDEGADGVKGEVEFRNVSFAYPDAGDAVIKNISFTAKRGETVAFIGSTGSGKSTLVNLIPRFYDVTDGAVYVDGRDVRDYRQAALRKKIGYVSQKAILFSGTVESNVAFGDIDDSKADMESVKRAVSIAQGTEFVEKMEQKYQANIAQGGANVSGGQKQRLSIARAVARDPEIYIFDDSFSALDYKTDRVLRTTLKREIGDATMLIVAQRIGTIRDADRIVVLDQGEVAGIGTHDELMATCSTYQEIARSQLSEEELKHA